MTSLVTKLIVGKLFKENKENKQGYEDPYFETVPATRLGFKTKKKLPKAHPPGLTEKEAQVLTKAKRRAYRLDLSLGTFLGIKVGWGAVIGLIPGIGDILDMFFCLLVYRTICSVEPGLDTSLKMKMQFNIVVDFIVGIVPIIGDLADAAYKCNTKNDILLEDELRKRGQKRLKGTADANLPDPSLADEFDYQTEAPPARTGDGRRQQKRLERRDRRHEDLESQAGTHTNMTIDTEPARPAKTKDRRERRDRY